MRALLIASLLVFGLSFNASAQIWQSFEVDGLSKNRAVKVPVDLMLPAGEGPYPAMVQVHDSSGPNKTLLYYHYGRHLNMMNVAVAIPNSFVSRGVKSIVEDQGAVTHIEMINDAFQILAYLSKHPKIDSKRIGIFGFSKGGIVAFYTAFKENADWLLPNGPRFALHVPFYPSCTNNSYYVETTGAPILLLLGAKDTYTNPLACTRLADKVKAFGSPIETITYPNARHSWDSVWPDFNNPKGHNYSKCILDEKADRSVVELHSGVETNIKGGALNAQALAHAWSACRTLGVTGGADPEARAQSFEDLRNVIAKTFGLPPPRPLQ